MHWEELLFGLTSRRAHQWKRHRAASGVKRIAADVVGRLDLTKITGAANVRSTPLLSSSSRRPKQFRKSNHKRPRLMPRYLLQRNWRHVSESISHTAASVANSLMIWTWNCQPSVLIVLVPRKKVHCSAMGAAFTFVQNTINSAVGLMDTRANANVLCARNNQPRSKCPSPKKKRRLRS